MRPRSEYFTLQIYMNIFCFASFASESGGRKSHSFTKNCISQISRSISVQKSSEVKESGDVKTEIHFYSIKS